VCSDQEAPTSDFRTAVHETIRREELFPPGSNVVVGLSGGPDSMALCAVLLELADELGIRVEAAHLDHDLRDDSSACADFAERQAEKWNIPFHRERINWADRGGRPTANVEASAREARYEFLKRVALPTGIVAVAHHAGDRLESFLVNLLRGAGPRGLSVPRYRREDGIVRPLLDRTRDEITAYLRERDLPSREDPTNRDASNLRSRLRSDVVPLLERENPDVARTVGRAAALLGDLDALVVDLARVAMRDLTLREGGKELALDGPRGRPYHRIVLSTLLREAIRSLGRDLSGIGFEPLERCARAWKNGEKCVLDLPGDVRIAVESGRVLVVRTGDPFPDIREQEIPVPGRIRWSAEGRLSVRQVRPPPLDPAGVSGPEVAWLDADRVVSPLRVRGRRSGDRYRPLGLPGSVKIQDLLVNRKIPREWRDSLPVVEDAEGIVWVPGFRVDHRTRITEDTETALRVEMIGTLPIQENQNPR
jgi:tRNA(Ile)-lysidine synthase